jgi:hypothetical protein
MYKFCFFIALPFDMSYIQIKINHRFVLSTGKVKVCSPAKLAIKIRTKKQKLERKVKIKKKIISCFQQFLWHGKTS